VRWLLEELSLPYELIYIDLFNGGGETSAYKLKHPLGCVPVMDVNGKHMFESGAICDWLVDCYPDKQLAPHIHSIERIEYKQWMYFIIATMEPHAWNIILHTKILPVNKRIPHSVVFEQQKYIDCLHIIDKELMGKKFLIGDKFTVVDILLTTLMNWLPKQLQAFKNIKSYCNKIKSRECYQLIQK